MPKKRRFKSFRSIFSFLFLLSCLFTSTKVPANVAAPSQGGTAGAEPSGLEQIYIVHENLNIDLRQLKEAASRDGQLISVEAIYEVENKGAEKSLDLIFVFGSNYKDFQVSLDNQPVNSQPAQLDEPPKNWDAPQRTPWLDGKTFDYAGSRSYARKPQGFSLVMPAGRHRLRASYKVEPTKYSSNPMKYWQFAYVLAPAREWAGFGGLDVTVYAPNDWTIVTTPNLEREGEILKGHFDQIPADSLALTAKAPLPGYYNALSFFFTALFILALFAAPVVLAFYAWKKGFQLKRAWLWGIGLSLLWTILIFVTGFLASAGADYAIPGGQYSQYGYGSFFQIFGAFLLSAAAFPIGLLLWFLTVNFARKKKASVNLS